MRPARFALLALLLTPALGSYALAQVPDVSGKVATPIPGAGHDYIHMLNETVNPATGSLSIRIDTGAPSARGFTVPFALVYNSSGVNQVMFDPSSSVARWYNLSSTLTAVGWSYSIPNLTALQGQSVFVNTSTNPPSTYTCTWIGNYVLQAIDGSRHVLAISIAQTQDDGTGCGNQIPPPINQLSGGDPFFQATTTWPGGVPANPTPVTVAGLDGTVYSFSHFTSFHATPVFSNPQTGNNYYAVPSSIEDRNGNVYSIAYSNGAISVTDSVGRSAVSVSPVNAGTNTISVSGLSNTFNVQCTTASSNFTTGQNYVGAPQNATTCNGYGIFALSQGSTAVQTLTLPNGKSYQFDYSSNPYGLVDKISYPSGGSVTYTWGENALSEQFQWPVAAPGTTGLVCTYDHGFPAITKRVVSFDGVNPALEQDFSYSTNWAPNGGNWTSKQTTVTTRDCARNNFNCTGAPSYTTVYSYLPFFPPQPPNSGSGPTPIEQSVAYNSTNGTMLKTETKGWFDQYSLACQLETLDSGQISGTFYTYQGFRSLVTDKKEYDYGLITSTSACQNSSTPPTGITPTRETAITYQTFASTPIFPTAPSILNRPSSVITYGSGTRAAETDYSYDQTAVSSVSNLPSGTHDETNYSASYNNRGNPTTKTVQCLQSCTNALTSLTYDETGQLRTAKDPCGNATCTDMTGSSHTTTYSYADNYDSPPSSNTNAYLTQISDPLGHASKFKYAYSDGQLIQATDQNNQVTSYTYADLLRRLTETDLPDGGKTTITYNDAPYNPSTPSPSVSTTKAITSSTNLTTLTALDGLGQAVSSVLSSDPDCASGDRTDTTYDGLGRVFTVSNPYCSTSNPTYGLTTHVYDALGRTTEIIPPDGLASANSVSTSYSGNSTTVIDQAGRERKTLTDALGRLVEVDEPGTGATTGSPGTGSATVNGSEQSTTTSTPGTGTVTIYVSNSDQYTYYPCGISSCPTTGYDSGTIYVTVGSTQKSASYYQATTPASVASALATAFNGDNNSLVTATSSGSVLTLTAKATGPGSNYPLSASVSSSSPSGYPYGCTTCPLYGAAPSGSTLTGGSNSTIYDTGSAWVTVNGVQTSVSYAQSSTTATLASALLTAINANTSSVVTASLSGSTVNLVAKGVGSSTNYTLFSGSSTSQPGTFPTPSFSVSVSGPALTGGTDGNLGTSPLVTLYTYDVLNNLTCAVQKGTDTTAFTTCAAASANWRPRSFTYNSLSRLTSSSNPESNTVSSKGSTLATTYLYDANGNLSSKTSPAPNQTGTATVTANFLYDAINRLTQKSFSDGTTPTIKYGYDAVALSGCAVAPPTLTDAYPIGRRTSMCDGAGAESWSHDTMGRVLTDARTTNGVTKTTGYTYTPYLDGSLNTITYPSSRVMTYATGTAERLLSVQDNSTGIYYAASAHYAPTGALSSLTNNTSLVSTLFYNSRLQPCRISVKSSGTAPANCGDTSNEGNVLDFSYGFNLGSADNGNVAFITNNRDNTRSQNFTYDALNRLATAQTQTSGVTIPNSNCWGITLGYDPWGNLLQSSITGPSGCGEPAPLNVSVTTANRISSYCYDSAGNLLDQTTCPKRPPHAFAYNAENQLTSAGGMTYSYDGDGKRVMKSNGTLYWYGMSADALDETDSAGNTNNSSFFEYVFFGGQRTARRDYQNNVNYYLSDHLGSSRVVTNSSGSILDDSDFYPFGGERPVASSSGNHYKFTGKERDSESGLDNFGARYNSSSFGRFTSPDWSAKAEPVPYTNLGDPQTMNLYAYVRNNPLNRTDPSGHYICNGNKAQCQAIADGLAQARAALNGQNLTKEQRRQLNKVVSTFGKAGDEHDGVTISFGQTTSPRRAAEAHSYEGENGVLKTDITFNSKVFGRLSTAEIGGDLVHERSHGIDGIARGNMDPQTKKEEFQTERKAYNVESLVGKGLNVPFYVGTANPLWNPNWPADSAEASRYTGVLSGAIDSTSDYCRVSGAPGC